MVFTKVILGVFLLYVTVVVSEETTTEAPTPTEAPTTLGPCTAENLRDTCWKNIDVCNNEEEWEKSITSFFEKCSASTESINFNYTLYTIWPMMCTNETVVNLLKGDNKSCFNVTTEVLIALSTLNTDMKMDECTKKFNPAMNTFKENCPESGFLVNYLQEIFNSFGCDSNAASTIVIAPVLFFVTVLLNINRFF